MATPKLNLPTITGNETADVPRDLNALASAIDSKAGTSGGIATLGPDGKVPGNQLNVSAPADASTTQKGVVQLNDNTDSTSVTQAATANAIRKVAENAATHLADYVKHPAFATATGAANNYAVTLNPAPASYIEGLGIVVAINDDSTAASSLNVNGLGAVSIKKANGNSVSNLKANGIYTVRYNTATASFILQGEGASGNASASDLLSGKTASTDAGDIIGTMSNHGLFNLGMGVPVPAGYYSGGTTATGPKTASGKFEIAPNTVSFVTINNLDFIPAKIWVAYSAVPTNNPIIDMSCPIYDFQGTFKSWEQSMSNIPNPILPASRPTSNKFTINRSSSISTSSTMYVDWVAYEY